MQKLVMVYLLFALLATLILPIRASVTIQTSIDQNVHVVFDFVNVNSTVYEEIKRESSLDRSTIPKTIVDKLKQRNLTHVAYYDPTLTFNDSGKSIHVTFYLSGLDVLNFTFSKATMAKVYYVRTDWRKFHLNVTTRFSLNFTKYFGTPVAQWQKINYTDSEKKMHPAYYYNYTGPSPFDPLCYFILPITGTNVRAVKDTIIFEVPPSLEDRLLNSPFLVVGAIIVVNIAIFLYRRVRK